LLRLTFFSLAKNISCSNNEIKNIFRSYLAVNWNSLWFITTSLSSLSSF
jgi:hypothetical protein